MERPIGDIVLPGLPLFRKGKVRDVFEVDDKLLIVATDRISAFDWVLGNSGSATARPAGRGSR